MVVISLTCPHCGSPDIVKNGHAPNGKQKYRCRACQRQSREKPTPHVTPEERREEILRAYQERSSLRGLARTFKVSHNTVAAWIKKKLRACRRWPRRSFLLRPGRQHARSWNWMNSGPLCYAKPMIGGSGSPCAAKVVKWSRSWSAIAARRPAGACGTPFRKLIAPRSVTATFGRPTPPSCRTRSIVRWAKKREKRRMWNAITTRFANASGGWCGRHCRSPKPLPCS
jgi:transposase-like protein